MVAIKYQLDLGQHTKPSNGVKPVRNIPYLMMVWK